MDQFKYKCLSCPPSAGLTLYLIISQTTVKTSTVYLHTLSRRRLNNSEISFKLSQQKEELSAKSFIHQFKGKKHVFDRNAAVLWRAESSI